jgi:hypothetical protein
VPLEKKYVRDFDHKIVGNVTTGFDNRHGSVVRDNSGHVLGRTSTRFNETRDANGHVVSSNTADPGLLIRKK